MLLVGGDGGGESQQAGGRDPRSAHEAGGQRLVGEVGRHPKHPPARVSQVDVAPAVRQPYSARDGQLLADPRVHRRGHHDGVAAEVGASGRITSDRAGSTERLSAPGRSIWIPSPCSRAWPPRHRRPGTTPCAMRVCSPRPARGGRSWCHPHRRARTPTTTTPTTMPLLAPARVHGTARGPNCSSARSQRIGPNSALAAAGRCAWSHWSRIRPASRAICAISASPPSRRRWVRPAVHRTSPRPCVAAGPSRPRTSSQRSARRHAARPSPTSPCRRRVAVEIRPRHARVPPPARRAASKHASPPQTRRSAPRGMPHPIASNRSPPPFVSLTRTNCWSCCASPTSAPAGSSS